MARWLKQSTSVDVPIGPFVDQTDGFTAETGLTLTQPDIRLKKNDGAWAQKNAAQTLSHEENGWYEVTLDATDTNTLGLLTLAVNESGALPVWHDFLVVPANIWDSLFGADFLQVDVAQASGTTVQAASGRFEVNVEQVEGTDATDYFATLDDATLAAIAALSIPSAATIATAVRESVIEGALTMEQVLRIVLAACSGISSQPVAGQRAYRDVANSKNRILATVSQGDRSAVTLDGSA